MSDLLLGDVLRLAARPERFAHKPALFWGDQAFTYAQLDRAANRAANALLALGLRKGDRVAVLGRNCPEYVWLYFGLARAGAIMVPVNFWYRSGEVAYTLRQSGARFFLFDEPFRAVAEAAIAAAGGHPGQPGSPAPSGGWLGGPAAPLGAVERAIAWDSRAAPGRAVAAPVGASPGRPAQSELDALVAQASDDAPQVALRPEDHHVILYTSGTTGFPKGALFTHRAHYLHAVAWALMTGQAADDVGLLVYPLFHTGGPDCVLLPHFLVGATVVLLDGADPHAMLDAIARRRATNVFCVPTVWRRLLAALDDGRHDVSSVRRCLGSSDTLPADLLDGLLERFAGARGSGRRERGAVGGAEVFVTYGLTEAGCILTYSRLTRTGRAHINSVGKPHPLVELRLAGPDGGVIDQAGAVGEVVARGPTLMDGYWAMPERTAEAMAGGWLRSGDLGCFDHDGYLYLAGRAKDVIITGGEKVYPVEVEKLLKQHPGVADAALVGVPDPEWGESVLACVVRDGTAAGAQLTGAALQQYVRRQLAGYKCPRYVEFVASLPVTSATGKIQKAVLRDRFRDEYLAGAERARA